MCVHGYVSIDTDLRLVNLWALDPLEGLKEGIKSLVRYLAHLIESNCMLLELDG